MSDTPEKSERSRSRSSQRSSPVTTYLMIMFLVAFLLLLYAYLLQQRSNQAAIDNLQQTSSSAVQSIQQLLEENEQLKTDLAEAQSDRDQAVSAAQAELEQQTLATTALSRLNHLRGLVNKGRASDARAFLAQLGETGVEETVTALTTLSDALSEEERAVYDPLSAWEQLVELVR